jgi:predicted SnoaL-like aldol condensation-catalyzing enzyme
MNNPSVDDAFEMVISFLTIVLKERPASIVAILRSIRRRDDGWSSDAVLKKIVQSVDDHYYKIYESRIDIDWIFGRKYEVDDENGNDDEHDTDDEELETDTSSNEEEEDTYEEEET